MSLTEGSQKITSEKRIFQQSFQGKHCASIKYKVDKIKRGLEESHMHIDRFAKRHLISIAEMPKPKAI